MIPRFFIPAEVPVLDMGSLIGSSLSVNELGRFLMCLNNLYGLSSGQIPHRWLATFYNRLPDIFGKVMVSSEVI